MSNQMSCKLNYSSLPLLHKLQARKPSHLQLYPSRLNSKLHPITSSQASDGNQEPSNTGTKTPPPATGLRNVGFETLEACKLGISWYPDFGYNAKGGNGTGTAKKKDTTDDLWVSFEVGSLYVPSLSSSTTRFIGLPLPPFLRIDIVPEILEGTISQETGKVDLQFRAKFWFSVGSIYRAPPLVVETRLTSEETKGDMKSGKGERMDGEGRCRLVGVAIVEAIDDVLMNSFLGLPTECIADLNARILISS